MVVSFKLGASSGTVLDFVSDFPLAFPEVGCTSGCAFVSLGAGSVVLDRVSLLRGSVTFLSGWKS